MFLYNVFSMNAYPAYANVTSMQMQAGLLEAVCGKGAMGNVPDECLIGLYASTSSVPILEAAYRAHPAQYNVCSSSWGRQRTDALKGAVWFFCGTGE